MSGCAEHRPYLAAVADREWPLVPPTTHEHVLGCAACREEVDAHRRLSARLREAWVTPSPQCRLAAVRTIPTRARAVAAVAALVLVLTAGGFAVRTLTGQDRVAAAAIAAARPVQFESSDSDQIGSWCQRAANRPTPEVVLPGLAPVGARMDNDAGNEIVTISYRAADGQVRVSWLDSTRADGSTIESRTVSGRMVLVVRSPGGSAVVSGTAPAKRLWDAAAAVAAGPVAVKT